MSTQGFPDLVAQLVDQLGDDRIRRVQLLYMPDSDSIIESLGEAAERFGDEDCCDGDAWLAPSAAFSDEQLAAAVAAGGQILWGYEFPYHRRIFAPGDMRLRDWHGDAGRGVGYTLWFDVAVVLCFCAFGCAK